MAYDIKQIRIGKHDVGIVDLTDVIEMVAVEYKDSTDEVIAEALLQKLSEDNYIPAKARDAYKQAFLREYQKHLNLPVTVLDAEKNELAITVVGPGCTRCENLEMTVMTALSDLKLAARVEHIRDLKDIAKMGIMGTPALLINGEVKCVGLTPSKSQIIEWLNPFQKL